MIIKIPDKITNIMAHLISHGYEAYIVGGAIRDSLLSIEPHDWDIFTDCQDLIELFPDGKVIGGEERQKKILTIVVDGTEVSSYRANGDRTETGTCLKQHQATCDFTINSIACDINGKIIDTQAGIEDLGSKTLSFVGNAEDRIKEDKLRVLRGIRFALKYNMNCRFSTKHFLTHTDISDLPSERIRDELIKILELNLKPSFIDLLDKFLPKELYHKAMYENGGKYHNETPIEHSVNAFIEASKITNDWRIRLAALLHDVAKGICKSEDWKAGNATLAMAEANVEKELHFYEHESKGAKIVEKWMENLKFNKDDIKFVSEMIHLHMFGYKEVIKDKTYIKFFNKLNDSKIHIMEYIMLIYSDHQGNMRKKRIKFGDFIKHNYLYNNWLRIRELQTPFTIHDLAIKGGDLIERLKIEPGPQVGRIMKLVLERIIDGDMTNDRAEIFRWIEMSLTLIR